MPSLKTLFNEHGTVTGEAFLRKMVTNFLVAKIEFCKTQPDLQELVTKFTKIKDIFYDRMSAASVRNENDFNVILHCDLWSNNVMFKYDADGELEDAVIVDFQVCYYGPPALDITYTLYTSSHNDVSDTDWDMLIQYYYVELRKTLNNFNYSKKVPSLVECQAQILKRGLYGAWAGIVCEALRMLDNVDENGLSSWINDDAAEYRLNMLLNPKVVPKIVKLLKYFDRRGYYECENFQY